MTDAEWLMEYGAGALRPPPLFRKRKAAAESRRAKLIASKDLVAGFSARSRLMLGLTANNASGFVPDDWMSEIKITVPHAFTGRNKFNMQYAMKAAGAPTLRVFGLINAGIFYRMLDERSNGPAGPRIEEFLRDAPIVMKIPSRANACPAVKAEWRDGSTFVNGNKESDALALAALESLHDHFVAEYCAPAEYAAAIWPAANTVRVLTVWDADRGEQVFVAAAHRFGDKGAGWRDHTPGATDGVIAAIDPQSGVLGACASFREGRRSESPKHPDSGVQIAGLAVPHWADILNHTLAAGHRFPHMPLLGWTWIVTAAGPKLIEATWPDDASVWQVHTPLLGNESVRRVFAARGIA